MSDGPVVYYEREGRPGYYYYQSAPGARPQGPFDTRMSAQVDAEFSPREEHNMSTEGRHPGFDFDEGLFVGKTVEARFTNNNRAIRFRGRVLKLNQRTARVESLDEGVNGWAAGHVFVIQRFSSPLWSQNNGLYPWHGEPAQTVELPEPVNTAMRAERDALDVQQHIAENNTEVQAERHFGTSPDYIVSGGGTVYLITAQNDNARENLEKNASAESQWLGDGLAVEHRYIGPLVEQLQNEGWVVA